MKNEKKITITRPSRHKYVYHGNGANAWYGRTEVYGAHTLEYVSVRYSYRSHKMIFKFDGSQLMTSRDYRRAEEIINEAVAASLIAPPR